MLLLAGKPCLLITFLDTLDGIPTGAFSVTYFPGVSDSFKSRKFIRFELFVSPMILSRFSLSQFLLYCTLVALLTHLRFRDFARSWIRICFLFNDSIPKSFLHNYKPYWSTWNSFAVEMKDILDKDRALQVYLIPEFSMEWIWACYQVVTNVLCVNEKLVWSRHGTSPMLNLNPIQISPQGKSPLLGFVSEATNTNALLCNNAC